jgi:hypothetical protein
MISLLAIIASSLTLVASVWYNRDVLQGSTQPNLSSWLVWTFITILSSSSYFAASNDGIKSLLAFSNSAATIITLGIIVWKGRFSPLTRFDRNAAIVAVASGLLWLITKSPAWSNFALQFAIALGCVPTYRTVWANPFAERPGPWLLWGISFILGIAVVALRWTGSPLELAYPVSGALLYGAVGILALRKPTAPSENRR